MDSRMRTALVAAALAAAAPALAQTAAPVVLGAPADAVSEPEAPRGFTSPAQARAYLSQSPAGARAETAFSALVTADLAAMNPDLDAGQIALGSALAVMPGAVATPAEIEAVINAVTPGIGGRAGWF